MCWSPPPPPTLMRFFAIASSRFSFRMAIIWSSRFRRDSSASADFLKDFFRESCRDADGRNMTTTTTLSMYWTTTKEVSLSLSLSLVVSILLRTQSFVVVCSLGESPSFCLWTKESSKKQGGKNGVTNLMGYFLRFFRHLWVQKCTW